MVSPLITAKIQSRRPLAERQKNRDDSSQDTNQNDVNQDNTTLQNATLCVDGVAKG
jgi:hypothetical protein